MGIHVKDKELLKSLMDKYTIGEIVDEYLEAGKCSSADILNIADDFWTSPEDETPIEKIDNIIDEERRKWYKDPNNYKRVSCEDMMKEIMLVHFDEDEILSYFDERDLLDKLEGTWELDNYVENKVAEAINDVNIEHAKEIDELIDAPVNKKGLMKTLRIIDLSPDDIHTIICELTNSNKYERDASVIIDRLKKILNKNNYGVTYE
jgi:hypothetical protein